MIWADLAYGFSQRCARGLKAAPTVNAPFSRFFEYSSPKTPPVPSAEVGVGPYGLRNQSERQTRDASADARVPELSGQGGSTEWAPGVSGAVGVDLFPGNGRIDIGAVVRLRAAGRPADGQLLGIGFACCMRGSRAVGTPLANGSTAGDKDID